MFIISRHLSNFKSGQCVRLNSTYNTILTIIYYNINKSLCSNCHNYAVSDCQQSCDGCSCTYQTPETVWLTEAMVKTLNNIQFLVNGPLGDKRIVSLWLGECVATKARIFMKEIPLNWDHGSGVRPESTADSNACVQHPNIIDISGHCIKPKYKRAFQHDHRKTLLR